MGLGTPGMSAIGLDERANDWYALGALMLGSILLVHGFVGFHRAALGRFLNELQRDLGLPDELVELVKGLTERPERLSAEPAAIAAAIEALPFGNVQSARTSSTLAPEPRDLERRLTSAVAQIEAYLRRTASPSRNDRLWPADLAVFETNPLSLAYGACGVLHALQCISGDCTRAASGLDSTTGDIRRRTIRLAYIWGCLGLRGCFTIWASAT